MMRPSAGNRRRPGSGRRAPRRHARVIDAGAAVDAAIAYRGLTSELRVEGLFAGWADVVGARIAARTVPDEIRARVLHILVNNSAWLHELTMIRAQLREAIRNYIGEPALVDDVRLELARRRRPDQLTERPVPRPRIKRVERTPVPATPAEAIAIEQEAATVEDADLRALIATVRLRHGR